MKFCGNRNCKLYVDVPEGMESCNVDISEPPKAPAAGALCESNSYTMKTKVVRRVLIIDPDDWGREFYRCEDCAKEYLDIWGK